MRGVDHPDTTSNMANLASVYRDQGRLQNAGKWEAMTDILERKGDDALIIEGLVKIARSFDEELIKLLLDWEGTRFRSQKAWPQQQ